LEPFLCFISTVTRLDHLTLVHKVFGSVAFLKPHVNLMVLAPSSGSDATGRILNRFQIADYSI
jgi:hypothetical protein